jgi:hypothetical protein
MRTQKKQLKTVEPKKTVFRNAGELAAEALRRGLKKQGK